jgi:hypothetical protein
MNLPLTHFNLESMHLPQTVLDVDDKHSIEINYFRASDNHNLFNEIAYFKLHAASESDCYMQLVSSANGKVHATITFYEAGEHVFLSPKRGTYGGLEIHSDLELKVLESFLAVAISHLKKLGAGEITIKLAPFSHDLALSSTMLNLLLRQGFQLDNHELNYDMQVDERPFLDRVSYGNNKRIRKCLRDGVEVAQVELNQFSNVYAVIKENRLRRGFSVSMTAEQLGDMVAIFPGKVFLFAAWENEQRERMIASAVCFAVSPSILYVFYWGDVAGVESYSPIALLASSIYGFCQQNGFRLLDVGTSTVAGEPNYGLINFKQHLGFSASLKPTFVWKN